MPACACFVSARHRSVAGSVGPSMHTNGSRTVTGVTWQRHTCALLHPNSRCLCLRCFVLHVIRKHDCVMFACTTSDIADCNAHVVRCTGHVVHCKFHACIDANIIASRALVLLPSSHTCANKPTNLHAENRRSKTHGPSPTLGSTASKRRTGTKQANFAAGNFQKGTAAPSHAVDRSKANGPRSEYPQRDGRRSRLSATRQRPCRIGDCGCRTSRRFLPMSESAESAISSVNRFCKGTRHSKMLPTRRGKQAQQRRLGR